MLAPSTALPLKIAVLGLSLTLGACATLSGEKRAAVSTVGCARAVVDSKVPAGLSDKRTHCMAAGMIARYCSVSEAYMAGVGKELKDLFTPGGDAEWADLQADAKGIRCARSVSGDADLATCCAQAISR
jgi:hypothetical protein